MPSTRRQKAKARKSREMGMMSDMDNSNVMLGNGNRNPIERKLADAIEQSCTKGMIIEILPTKMIHSDKTMSVGPLRLFFTNEFNLRLSQETDSMMSMMHNQINRAISTAIAEKVIPSFQRFKPLLVQCHLQEIGTLRQACPQ